MATPAMVVGIGASAGGLDALEKLFSVMPTDLGIAFVVVQHLERRHPSILAELLGRHTRMPVRQAEDDMRPEPDHVYVIAPNTILTIDRGALRVAAAPEESSPARIDAFLRSLAEDRGENAVGVVLSGAGADGTAGLRAIKEHGGLVLAQDPRTAKNGSMPRNAIDAGVVDQVLEIEQLPSALLAHGQHLAISRRTDGATLDADLQGSLRAICTLLQQRTGHDFSRYKEGTLLRRIRRRVHILRAASASDYLRILEEDPGEPQRLLKDLLIGVTHFFRDPETFGTLEREIVPRIVEGKPGDVPVRIWVPGCASGEEAYSIAILVHEQLARETPRRFGQIFATDLDAGMVAEARAGRYSAEIDEHVSPERLERYFVRDGSGWRVGTELRETCIFSVHSLIRDPPFSALDLISCRNVLIYLEPDLQKKVIPLLHYALRRGGYLLLGPAEGLVNHPELFETVDKKHRIFRRKETIARPQVEFPLSTRAPRSFEAPPAAAPPAPTPQQKATAAIERMLLDDYAPSCAVVNERGDIQFVAGRIGRFLAPLAGAPATNLLDAVRNSLRVELRMALHTAATSGAKVIRDGVPVELEDAVHRVRLTVRPVPGTDGLFAVVVQERALEEVEGLEVVGATLAPAALEQIERELRTTRADLKAAVESAEAANEELRSANEELISTNEELQSANEEMQTSKEELQSLNEELETVNTELHRNVEELGTVNSDLQNLFASTEIATLFLDRDLRITKFTPAATELFRLIEGDIGRPIGDFAPRFDGQDLVADAREVLRTLKPIERQVRAAHETTWFILRVLPYRTVENVIAGVVITFVDVSELKRVEEALRESEERFRLLVEGVKDHAIFVLAPNGTVATWNFGAERLKGYRAEEIVGEHFCRFYTQEDVRAGKPQRELEVAAAEGRAESEGWRLRKDGTRYWANVVITALRDDDGRLRGFANLARDFTERKQMEDALRESESRFRTLFETMSEGFALNEIISDEAGKPRDLRYLEVNPGFERHTGLRAADTLGRTTLELFPDAEPMWFERYGKVALTGEPAHFQAEFGPLGRWFEVSAYQTQPGRFATVFFDITDRKRAAEALERSRQGLGRLAEASLSVMAKTDLEGMLQAISEAALALTGARMATCGHGFVSGQFVVGGSARVPGAPACPPGNMFQLDRGGVHMALVEGAQSIRLTDEQMRAHPRWWGLPQGHVPMRGLLGVPMFARNGQTNGMILVTEKEQGEFSAEDELLIRQLATIASLALQHVEARITLEESDRSKNQFLAMLSHELRSPLAPIRNSLYILDRAAPGGEQARRAQTVIVRQVVHLTRLVDDLLDATRISHGKIQLQRERMDLCDVVHRAIEDNRWSFEQNGVELHVSLPAVPVWIDGDRTRIAQVIGNLLHNAAKFTHPGGAATISVERNESVRQAIVRVRDTGVGIAPEMLPRVFEPFAQADTTLDRRQGGLGLGLALVKGFVEMHGGTVSVESEGPGRGAEFTVRLPLESAELPPAAPVRSAVARGPRRVLVIEDSVDAAESLREVLELGEHTVEVAFSGAEGIEKARAFRPDVVLCDIGLPGMDGYQVARAMRADPALRETKLVALTGYAAPEDIIRSREAGFDAHLAKPPSLDKIEEALASGADGAQPARGSGEPR